MPPARNAAAEPDDCLTDEPGICSPSKDFVVNSHSALARARYILKHAQPFDQATYIAGTALLGALAHVVAATSSDAGAPLPFLACDAIFDGADAIPVPRAAVATPERQHAVLAARQAVMACCMALIGSSHAEAAFETALNHIIEAEGQDAQRDAA